MPCIYSCGFGSLVIKLFTIIDTCILCIQISSFGAVCSQIYLFAEWSVSICKKDEEEESQFNITAYFPESKIKVTSLKVHSTQHKKSINPESLILDHFAKTPTAF